MHDHAGHDLGPEHGIHAGPEMRPTRERHAGHDVDVLRRKFWVVLFLTLPVLVYSEGLQMLLGFSAPEFPGSHYIPFVFGTTIFFYGGLFFLRGAIGELADRLPGMMTLISLAITVAFVYSLAITFGLPGEALYWELSTLILIMLLGHWMEMRAISGARGALQELAKLMPDEADRVRGNVIEVVPVSELHAGDLVLLRPGAKVPADGEVVDGESSVNESMITGESRPVIKEVGSRVIAGTINVDGALRVTVTGVGEHTALAGIMRLVAGAQASRSAAQNLADRAAFILTIVAIGAGSLTFGYWMLSPLSVGFALERTVTVLVIACPHALGLAIPLVLAISTTIAARNGLLVRDRLALEAARHLDVVVFDKTGTLTKGEHGVVDIFTVPGVDNDKALAVMAAVEESSEHIIARALLKAANDRSLEIPEIRSFKAMPGRGVEAVVHDIVVRVGGPRLLESLQTSVPSELDAQLAGARGAGQTLVYLVEGERVRAAVALADVIRPESSDAVRELKEMGVEVAMLTGDSQDVAGWVAAKLGISEYYANVLPEDKDKMIRDIRGQGRRVAMVGDGINDAPALISADVGIAIGAGTDVAVESGGIILVRNDPRDVAGIVRLSKASYRKMIENLLWATGYNVVAIPLAAGALYTYGIVLPPAVGAILMSASTVIVALNAQLLRRLRITV